MTGVLSLTDMNEAMTCVHRPESTAAFDLTTWNDPSIPMANPEDSLPWHGKTESQIDLLRGSQFGAVFEGKRDQGLSDSLRRLAEHLASADVVKQQQLQLSSVLSRITSAEATARSLVSSFREQVSPPMQLRCDVWADGIPTSFLLLPEVALQYGGGEGHLRCLFGHHCRRARSEPDEPQSYRLLAVCEAYELGSCSTSYEGDSGLLVEMSGEELLSILPLALLAASYAWVDTHASEVGWCKWLTACKHMMDVDDTARSVRRRLSAVVNILEDELDVSYEI